MVSADKRFWNKKMRSKPEKVEENKFVAKVKRAKGLAIKLSTQGMYGRRGLNDRCAFMFPGVVVLFEFKRKGQVARKLQKYMHKEFKRMDIPCYVVYTCKKAWSILQREIKQAKRVRKVYDAFRDEEEDHPFTRRSSRRNTSWESRPGYTY